MNEDQPTEKIMFDFNSFEEYSEFNSKANRLRSDAPFVVTTQCIEKVKSARQAYYQHGYRTAG